MSYSGCVGAPAPPKEGCDGPGTYVTVGDSVVAQRLRFKANAYRTTYIRAPAKTEGLCHCLREPAATVGICSYSLSQTLTRSTRGSESRPLNANTATRSDRYDE